SIIRRRAADAGNRARAHDESAFADPRRSDRGSCTAGPRRNLALPGTIEGIRPVDPGDRQKCRRTYTRCRSALPDRAWARGVEGLIAGARRSDCRAAPLPERLIVPR